MCPADHASNLPTENSVCSTKHFVTMLHALTVVSSHRRTSDLDVDDSLDFSHALTFSRTTGGISQGPHPRHCLACGHRPYQKRTKYRQIYRYFRLLTLSNLFRVNSRRVALL